jgi:hypothetical protein
MIVFASMLFYHDAVAPIQFLGFSIALGGLAYYQLGGAPAFKGYFGQAKSRFTEYRRLSGEVDEASAVEMAEEVAARKTERRGSEEEIKSPGIVHIKSA